MDYMVLVRDSKPDKLQKLSLDGKPLPAVTEETSIAHRGAKKVEHIGSHTAPVTA
jgi:hypothetical protein